MGWLWGNLLLFWTSDKWNEPPVDNKDPMLNKISHRYIQHNIIVCVVCREPFRFLLNSDAHQLYEHFTHNLKWASLEARPQDAETVSSTPTSLPGVLDESHIFLPGSGMFKKIYSLRCAHANLWLCFSFWWFMLMLQLFKKHKNDSADYILFSRWQYPRCSFTYRTPGPVDFSNTTWGM